MPFTNRFGPTIESASTTQMRNRDESANHQQTMSEFLFPFRVVGRSVRRGCWSDSLYGVRTGRRTWRGNEWMWRTRKPRRNRSRIRWIRPREHVFTECSGCDAGVGRRSTDATNAADAGTVHGSVAPAAARAGSAPRTATVGQDRREFRLINCRAETAIGRDSSRSTSV